MVLALTTNPLVTNAMMAGRALSVINPLKKLKILIFMTLIKIKLIQRYLGLIHQGENQKILNIQARVALDPVLLVLE